MTPLAGSFPIVTSPHWSTDPLLALFMFVLFVAVARILVKESK